MIISESTVNRYRSPWSHVLENTSNFASDKWVSAKLMNHQNGLSKPQGSKLVPLQKTSIFSWIFLPFTGTDWSMIFFPAQPGFPEVSGKPWHAFPANKHHVHIILSYWINLPIHRVKPLVSRALRKKSVGFLTKDQRFEVLDQRPQCRQWEYPLWEGSGCASWCPPGRLSYPNS